MLHPALKGQRGEESSAARSAEARLDEAANLVEAIGLTVGARQVVTLRAPRPSHLLGPGQVDTVRHVLDAQACGLVVIDGTISPVQQRNLERAWDAKVIDRTGLILEIFGERAHTREGALQVELAHLTYQQSRLVRSWTHLERQRGGFGFLGGPGETQIETDRRLIRDRIARLRRDLDEVKRTRGLHRERRQRAPYPVVALVGYTNAGKSSLFNRLTGADVLAKDMVFATLDPTMRGVQWPGLGRVILSDTVGFISDLPTQLVAAFRATLEEVIQADVLLHVRDSAHPDTEAQRADVLEILTDLGLPVLGAGEGTPAQDGPMLLEVFNKTDLLADDARAVLAGRLERRSDAVGVSAITGEGLDLLRQRVTTLLAEAGRWLQIELSPADGEVLAWLHRHGEVAGTANRGEQLLVDVRLNERSRNKLLSLWPATRVREARSAPDDGSRATTPAAHGQPTDG